MEILRDEVCRSGLIEPFNIMVNNRMPLERANSPRLKEFILRYYRIIIDTKQTEVLRLLVGSILFLKSQLDPGTRAIDQYFKNFDDLWCVVEILFNQKIIDEKNCWQSVTFDNSRGYTETSKDISCVFALIDCLQNKGYLIQEKKKARLRRAFCNSFGIKHSAKILNYMPNSYLDLVVYFNTIIPNRF